MGPDGLSATFLKAIAEVIIVPLTVIPTTWKQSSITPIHKGGSHDDPSNYSPIVSGSYFSKDIGEDCIPLIWKKINYYTPIWMHFVVGSQLVTYCY